MLIAILEEYQNLLYPWIWNNNNVVLLSQKEYDNEEDSAERW